MIGHGETIRVPVGREQIDAECELTLVVGAPASRVPVDKAGDFIFGYTIQNDVSDRRGRADDRHGSDWLVAKGFDTFAPIGPFVVPKEFVPDPQKLAVTLKHNDTLMTNSNTSRMTHTRRPAGHRQPGRRRSVPAALPQGRRCVDLHGRGRGDAAQSGEVSGELAGSHRQGRFDSHGLRG